MKEQCYISNMESGKCLCVLVRKDTKYAYYTHVWALEGTKNPQLRRCNVEIWNKYKF
jgi:hypothetical protein